MDEPITKIISNPLVTKLGHFTQEKLNVRLTKIKNRKAAGLDEIPPEVWKTRKFDNIQLWYCNAVHNHNIIDRGIKSCILPFLKKGDLRIVKNYWGITLTSIAAKIYNALLLNHIEPEIEKILTNNQNGFWRNRSSTLQILTICLILEGVCAKNLKATLICRLLQGKMEQILLAYGLHKETVAAIMMLYKNMKVKVHSPDGETDFLEIVTGVLCKGTH